MEDIIILKNIKLTFLSTKEDKYDNEISYFRLGKNMENKFSQINKVGFRLPYFEISEQKYLLKVKNKYIKIDLKKDEPINCEIHLKYYKIDNFEGFYVSTLK